LIDYFEYDNEHEFLDKLRELKKSGVDTKDIEIRAPHPLHHLDEVLGEETSGVRKFAVVGCLLGAFTGYAFPSFTHTHWALNNAGKPIVSIPPFTVIAFELMILFGALASFLGFIILSRMPAVRTIISDDEFVDSFQIHVTRNN